MKEVYKSFGKLPAFRGPWVSGVTYHKFNIVFHNGSSFIAKDEVDNEPLANYNPNTDTFEVSVGWSLMSYGGHVRETNQLLKELNKAIKDEATRAQNAEYELGTSINELSKKISEDIAAMKKTIEEEILNGIGNDVDTLKTDVSQLQEDVKTIFSIGFDEGSGDVYMMLSKDNTNVKNAEIDDTTGDVIVEFNK